ncbi:MAG: hypothetical protein Q7O66_22990, partial [Dehalococcoidia bacterium]|nr:hypothetical protein [Dehalococcoidia bacterium]
PLFYMDVLYDPAMRRYRMWYNIGFNAIEPAFCYAYAESVDGLKWTRPNLGLVEVQGSKNNNLIDAPFDHAALVFVDDGPNCPDPSRRYKMAFTGDGLWVAFSPDGYHFKEYPENPVIEMHANNVPIGQPGYENNIGDIADGCWDPLKNEYLVGCKVEKTGFPGRARRHFEGYRRCVGMTTSRDFIHWYKPRLLFTPDPANGMEEFYGFKPMVRGNLYIGFMRVLRDDLAADDVGMLDGIGWTELISSRDGLKWTRYQEKFLDRDLARGKWDHAMAWFADCITVGDKDYIYYGGYSAGHKTGDRQLGMAILRKNGFVSRNAEKEPGLLKTPLAELPADSMTLNADVRGEMKARIVDSRGRALPGFDWADCIPIRGDSVSHLVKWRGSPKLPRFQQVSVEFSLRDAEFYGFDF